MSEVLSSGFFTSSLSSSCLNGESNRSPEFMTEKLRILKLGGFAQTSDPSIHTGLDVNERSAFRLLGQSQTERSSSPFAQ